MSIDSDRWVVCASVRKTVHYDSGITSTTTVQVPTFYLYEFCHGIHDEADAIRIARRIIDPLGAGIVGEICVVKV